MAGLIQWVVLGSVLSGCGSVQYVYTVQPLPVAVRPSDEPWGVEVAVEITDVIRLEVVNTSQEPVRIVWDDCAYVDVEGRSHRLRTAGGEPAIQVPVTVAPHSRIETLLSPVADSLSSGSDPLLPGRPAKAPAQPGLVHRLWPFRRDEAGREITGKTFSLFLVLERNGSRRTVTAPYAVTHVGAGRYG